VARWSRKLAATGTAFRCNADDQPLGVRLGPGCRSVHVSVVRPRDPVNSEFACDTEPFRRKLMVHCYGGCFARCTTPRTSSGDLSARMAFLRRVRNRSSLRTWLYRAGAALPARRHPRMPQLRHRFRRRYPTRTQATGQARRGLSVSAHLACGDGQPSGTSAASLLPRRHCVLLVFPRDVRLRRRQRRVLAQPSASV
jgi:hypothetical protein